MNRTWLRGWRRFLAVHRIALADASVVAERDRVMYIPGSHLSVHVGRGLYWHPAAQPKR
jgi:hypothetical protein